MSVCPKCTSPIAPDARFCTECGTAIPSLIPPAELDECGSNGDQAHTVLAAANLCKLRGEWQTAIDKCILVLALDEDNAAAHSLLGDIYRDQGHLSEAMHWYKLALDLDPDSVADKNKLDQILSQKYPDRATQTDRKAELTATAKRVVVEAALAIGVLLVITTIWPVLFRPRASFNQTNKPTQHPQTVQLPSVIPDESPDSRAPEVRPTRPAASSEEDVLARTLNASPTLAARKLHVKSVVRDPRNRSATITCICEPAGESAAEHLARSGLTVLREACFRDGELDRMTVRVVYGTAEGGSTDVRFVADTERSALLSINPETAEPSQLAGVLRNPWWAPGVK